MSPERPAATVRPTVWTVPLLVLLGVGLWLAWEPTLIIAGAWIFFTALGLWMHIRRPLG